ncbi:low affinity iron permease family protein [Microbispora sp. NPDC049125]|uniref:low affinity iron permease family protein n=1 Tax=Microbispora sp. NPDC049125 TaxID=3154929 RepID=UPI0034667942
MNAKMPSQSSDHLSGFDRFAGAASAFASRAVFFALCVALVGLWAPSYFLFRDLDTWQLIINTATTIITFLLVALLQNAQRRADQAAQRKLNAIAVALADVMLAVDSADDASRRELRAAVGLEDREGA